MKTMRSILLLILLATLCRAGEPSLKLLAADAEPVAKIAGPEKALAGNPVLLQTESSAGKAMKWIVFPNDAGAVFLSVVTEEGQRVGLFVSPKPGTYYFALAAASGDKIAVAKHTLVVEGPQPSPAPEPTPVGKMWTVIVEESGQLTPAQGKVVASKAAADWIETKRHHKAWVIDKDALDENDKRPASLKQYVGRAKSLPFLFLVSETGTVLYEGPLPETETALVELLKKHGE